MFSKKLGFDDDIEEGQEVLSTPATENKSVEEVHEDDGSPEIQNIRHLVKVPLNSFNSETFIFINVSVKL